MKVAIRFITVLCLALTAISATAQILYDNGPVNGTANAWQISDGLSASNSFRCCRVDTSGPSGGAAMLAGFDFYAWVLASPDDTEDRGLVNYVSGKRRSYLRVRDG